LYQLTLIHSALWLLLLTLRKTNEQTYELGVEEQLLHAGQEPGLVQAQVISADLKAEPLVVPGKLEAGQLLVPRSWRLVLWSSSWSPRLSLGMLRLSASSLYCTVLYCITYVCV
jgi:hypothetical protein